MVQKIKTDSGCVICGYNEHPAALHFDHLPEYEKVMDVSRMCGRSFSEQRILEEIDKCEIVCANCHAIRTFVERKQHASSL